MSRSIFNIGGLVDSVHLCRNGSVLMVHCQVAIRKGDLVVSKMPFLKCD